MMWLITGPFDNEQQTDDIPNKTKLVRSGITYTIGRHQESALRINNKRISRNNGELIIGIHAEDDIAHPAVVPSVTFRNTRNIALRVTRGDKSFSVEPSSERALESGDLVRLASDINFTVSWNPIVCFIPEDSSLPVLDRGACASLGIKLVTKHTRDITHHLVPSIEFPLPPSILLSLLNRAAIVTPQWLTAFLDAATSLHQTYKPPLGTDYTPDISPQLSLIHQDPKLLSPNEDRKGLFTNLTFVFVVIGSGIGSQTKAMADVVVRGGGERKLVDIEKEAAGDTSKNSWKNSLKRARLGGCLVLVGDDMEIRERGVPKDIKKTWEGMLEKASIEGLHIIHPSSVSNAILNADASLLNCAVLSEDKHKQPEAVQTLGESAERTNTENEKDPSQQMELLQAEPASSRPSRRLTRRAASIPRADDASSPLLHADVQEASNLRVQNMELDLEDSGPKRRILKRRAKTTGLVNTLLGLDDINDQSTLLMSNNEEPVVEPPTAAAVNVPVPPSPGDDISATQPRRPLKRRARGNSQTQLFPETADEDRTGTPQLKRFKTLFEKSGRGEINSLPIEEEGEALNSQPTALEAVPEEEEESQPQMHTLDGTRRLIGKRKLASIEEQEDGSRDISMQPATRKRRAIAGAGAIEPSQDFSKQEPPRTKPDSIDSSPNMTTKLRGAEPGKHDVDISFLKAIASLKRGKRTEDDFDREFNQLRISKPKIKHEKAKENEAPWTWQGLDDFERDIGIRGNFMQIVEIEVWRDQQLAERYRGERLDWEGRQNFKKFKKKSDISEREVIPLEAVGSQEYAREPSIDYRPPPRRTKKRFPSLDVLEEDFNEHQEEGHPVLTNKQNKLTNVKARAPPRLTNKPPPSSYRKKAVADDNDFEDDEDEGFRPLSGRSLRKTTVQPTASSSKKAPDPLFVEDSEDEIENVALPQRVLRSTQGQSQSQSQSINQDMMMDTEETLRSEPREASQPQTQLRGTKRKAPPIPVMEDDEDEEGAFGGFSRRSATRRRN